MEMSEGGEGERGCGFVKGGDLWSIFWMYVVPVGEWVLCSMNEGMEHKVKDGVARCFLGLLFQYITYTIFCPKLRPFISHLCPISLFFLQVCNLAARFVYIQ